MIAPTVSEGLYVSSSHCIHTEQPKNIVDFRDRPDDVVDSLLVGSLLFGSVVRSSRTRVESEVACDPFWVAAVGGADGSASNSICTFVCGGVGMRIRDDPV